MTENGGYPHLTPQMQQMLVSQHYAEFKKCIAYLNTTILRHILAHIAEHGVAHHIEPCIITRAQYGGKRKNVELTNLIKEAPTDYEELPDGRVAVKYDAIDRIRIAFCDIDTALRDALRVDITRAKASNASVIMAEDATDEDLQCIEGMASYAPTTSVKHHEYIKPNAGFETSDLYKNFEEYPDGKFIANTELPLQSNIRTTTTTVQRATVFVTSDASTDTLPVSKKTECPKCGTQVIVTKRDFDRNVAIKCTGMHGATECDGTIKSTGFEKYSNHIQKDIYYYNIVTLNTKGVVRRGSERQFVARSLCLLKQGMNIVNLLVEDDKHVLILSTEYPENQLLFTREELDAVTLPPGRSPSNFNKLLYTIKEVIKNRTGFTINQKGEMLQVHGQAQGLVRLYLDNIDYHTLTWGPLGVAKTVPVQIANYLWFEKPGYSTGGVATRASMIAMMSPKASEQGRPGALAVHDVIHYDEVGRAVTYDKDGRPLSELFDIIKEVGRSKRMGREAGVRWSGERLAQFNLTGNVSAQHLLRRERIMAKIYKDTQEKQADPKLKTAAYARDHRWPLIVADPDFLGQTTGNPFVAEVYRQTDAYFTALGQNPYTGVELATQSRFAGHFIVEGSDIAKPKITRARADDIITHLSYYRLYYPLLFTVRKLFPHIAITDEMFEEAAQFLEQFAEEYPSFSNVEGKLDVREADVFMPILEVLMILEGKPHMTQTVRDTFTEMFRYHNRVLTREQYEMRDAEDLSRKTREYVTLANIKAGDFARVEHNIMEDGRYADTLNECEKHGYLERVEADTVIRGYRVTELGELRFHELSKEYTKRSEEFKKGLELVDKTKEEQKKGGNPFEGAEL